MTKRNYQIPITLLMLSILIVACGGGGNSNSTNEPTSITYKNLTYKTLQSPLTGKIWLDRNLGATQACENFDDVLCFGNYYQWGRDTDGHEKSDSLTQSMQINDLNTSNSKFVIGYTNWSNDDINGTRRQDYWAHIDGSSVCPKDFRIPTFNEILEEFPDQNTSNHAVFENFMKLPSAGLRWPYGGQVIQMESQALIWSNDIRQTNNALQAKSFIFSELAGRQGSIGNTSYGIPLRCIKN